MKTLIERIRSRRAGRVLMRVISACMLAAVLYVAVISGLMIKAPGNSPQDGATLIILGCQVRGEMPSPLLFSRMNAALAFMQDNPESVAVLSGGQGDGEWISEAEAMRRHLTAHGISDERLFLEDRSTSTHENIHFSKAIIDELGLSQNVALATDGFHQFRAQSFSKDAGLSPGAVASATPLHLLPRYWLREIAAITTQVVLK